MRDYAGKKVYVCGAERSGAAAAALLKRLGAEPTVYDLNDRANAEKQLARLSIPCVFGRNPGNFAGVYAMVLSPGIPRALPFVTAAEAAGVYVLGEIELSASVCPNKTIAITGTNGKTTTTTLVGEIMAAHRPGSVTAGNIGTPFADSADTLTDGAFAVLEASSFQLETVDTFKPAVAAVLNLTIDHLNRHVTMESYRAMKERVFANQTEADALVLNADDPACAAMAARAKSRIGLFSRLREVERGAFLRGGKLWLRLGDIDEALLGIDELRIFGAHNIENALAASVICAFAGAPAELIRRGIADFGGVEHRIEFTRELRGVSYYNDSKATNPDSAIKALEAFERPILLIAGGRDKDSEYGPLAALFRGKVKLLVTLGEAAGLIENAAKAADFTAYERVNSMRDAVNLCAARAEAGDCVLLSPACASFDMFKDYEERGRVFKECVGGLAE